MKTMRYFVGIVATISMIIIFLISAFEIAMYLDFEYYEKEYRKYQVLSDLDMEMDDVMYVTQEMMAYLRGEREELRVMTTVEGKWQDFFNEQDRFHMEEVQQLFLGGLKLRTGAIVVFVICAGLLVITRKKEWLYILSRSYQMVLGVFTVLLLALGIGVVCDFNAVFVKFHELFFDNDLWIFDPAEDYMIRMLPEGLFYDFVIRIGGFFAIGLTIALLFTIIVVRKHKKISDTYE